MKTRLFATLCSLLLSTGLTAGLWVGPAQATTLVSEDFEGVPIGPITTTTGGGAGTGPTGVALGAKGWTNIYCGTLPCWMDIVSMTGHTGATTNVIRATYPGQHCVLANPSDPTVCATPLAFKDWEDTILKRFFSPQTELWDRYWIRYEPVDPTNNPLNWNFVLNNGNSSSFKHHFYNLATSGQHVLEFLFNGNMTNNLGYITETDGSLTVCPATGLSTIACPFPANVQSAPMTVGQWYCVETHLKLNTNGTTNTANQDGIVEVWVNGVQTTRYTNAGQAWLGNYQPFTNFMIYRQGGVNLYRYEDDLVIATTRVGCSGSPSADTTPPTAPVGLTIR
jgi:hypothetical protein